MKEMNHETCDSETGGMALLLGSTAQARAGKLYLDDGDRRIMYEVDTATATVVNSWTAAVASRSYPIAVSGDIRTTGYASGETGALYNLSGVYQGTNYSLPSTPDTFSDGTTDGTYNYAVSWYNGDVYRFSRTWTNPTRLFTAGKAEGGITYDSSNNSLWLSADRAWGSRTGHLLERCLLPSTPLRTESRIGTWHWIPPTAHYGLGPRAPPVFIITPRMGPTSAWRPSAD